MQLSKDRSAWYDLIESHGACHFVKHWLINNMRLRKLKVDRAEKNDRLIQFKILIIL